MAMRRHIGDDEAHPAGGAEREGGGGIRPATGRGIPVAEVLEEVRARLASGACRAGERFPIVVEGRAIMVAVRGPAECG